MTTKLIIQISIFIIDYIVGKITIIIIFNWKYFYKVHCISKKLFFILFAYKVFCNPGYSEETNYILYLTHYNKSLPLMWELMLLKLLLLLLFLSLIKIKKLSLFFKYLAYFNFHLDYFELHFDSVDPLLYLLKIIKLNI